MTAIGVISIQQDLDQKRAELFEHETDELTRVVEERIEGAAAIMRGLDGLFAAGDVARHQFDDYIARIEHSPGFDAVNAVGFNRLVRREDVPSFEDRVRSDTSLNGVGYPDFSVFPPGESEILYVIDYVSPAPLHATAMGFDLGSNPERRVTVEKARDTGELVVTAGIEFLSRDSGVLLFQPLYNPGAKPSGLDERRAQFIGVTAGGFRTEDLLADMSYPDGVNLLLTDEGVIGDVETSSTVLTTAGSSSPAREGACSSNTPSRSPTGSGWSPLAKRKLVLALPRLGRSPVFCWLLA
jgi:CHASE1-domain containing sensor protein